MCGGCGNRKRKRSAVEKGRVDGENGVNCQNGNRVGQHVHEYGSPERFAFFKDIGVGEGENKTGSDDAKSIEMSQGKEDRTYYQGDGKVEAGAEPGKDCTAKK